jgi:cytochrome c oxidase assembly protein subunit 15
MAVGFLIIVLMVMHWRRWLRTRDPAHTPWLATFTLFAVCLQGAFGAWTVTMKLQPAIVTAHLLGGLSLLALLAWQALRESGAAPLTPAAARLRPLAGAAFALLVLQIALGGWVSTNYAVLACPDFPLCHGRLIPDMDFAHGFTLWRDLGMTGGGEPIPFQALVAVHWVHRMAAFAVIAVLGLLAWRAWRQPALQSLARLLAALTLLQFATGLSNVVLSWPLLLAVLHSGGAAALVAVMVAFGYRLAGAPSSAMAVGATAPAR